MQSDLRDSFASSKEPTVSLKTIGTQLVEMCNQGETFDVMRTMYTPDIVSLEAGGQETARRTPGIQLAGGEAR
jgi:hypothetical protein